MHSMHNERKSVITERSIRTLKKITFTKNVYTDKLDHIVI